MLKEMYSSNIIAVYSIYTTIYLQYILYYKIQTKTYLKSNKYNFKQKYENTMKFIPNKMTQSIDSFSHLKVNSFNHFKCVSLIG